MDILAEVEQKLKQMQDAENTFHSESISNKPMDSYFVKVRKHRELLNSAAKTHDQIIKSFTSHRSEMKDFSEGEIILNQQLLIGSRNNVNPNTNRLRVVIEDGTEHDEIIEEIVHLNQSFRKARTDKCEALSTITLGYNIFIELRHKSQETINFQKNP